MITKTIMTLGIMASFVIGISFSSVYAGIPWGTDDIADEAITTEKIDDKTIKNIDIRGNQIKTGKIRDGTILGEDIDSTTAITVAGLTLLGQLTCPSGACVGGDDIGDGAIFTEDIFDGSLLGLDLADGTVTTVDIADETIISADMAQPSQIALQTVGTQLGSLFSIECPPGSVATGMNVRHGALIDDIQLKCRDVVRTSLGPHIGPVLGNTVTTSAWATGSGGGVLATFDCAPAGGAVVHSFKMWDAGANAPFVAMDVGCLNLTTGALTNGPDFGDTSSGFDTGFQNCPANRVVTHITGWENGWVRQFTPGCA